VHAVTYFAPESRAALDGLGYRGFWMGYFAARSAPLGIVPREVVAAIFYNFAPERVAKALPAAWEIAGPDAALRARQDSAVAALRRYGIGADENVRVAAELAGRAARQAPLDGRPLFAANLALPWPDDPLAALWHAARLLREQRGDAHVAVLPKCPVHSYSKDGAMRVVPVSDPVYAPNSKGGPQADPSRTAEALWYTDGEMVRTAYTLRAEDDDWGQAGTLVRDVMDDAERQRLASNVAGHLRNGVSEQVLERAFEYWKNIDKETGEKIEAAVRDGSK
jgi:hypothetical protein